MKSINGEVRIKLLEIEEVREVYHFYPKTFTNLPCITYYEVSNKGEKFADDVEYSTEIAMVIDIWGVTPEEVEVLIIKVNEKMAEIGGVRELCHDIYEESCKRKNMRFGFIR